MKELKEVLIEYFLNAKHFEGTINDSEVMKFSGLDHYQWEDNLFSWPCFTV